jgi:hypothetical protein
MTDSNTSRSVNPARYAKVLQQCRDIVLVFSDTQMSELFENAGTALLDFAERAENNTIQGRFFEAMSLLQQRRPDIEQAFRRELSGYFDNFSRLAPAITANGRNVPEEEDSELALVEPDEMEEDVAAENLVIRANATYFPELFALGQRLSVINGGRKLKDSQIPASPHHLVSAFRRSIDGLDIQVKVKVILYALFDKYVLNEAKSIYDELNSSLKAAGILPNLKPVHVRDSGGAGRPASSRRAREEKTAAGEPGSAHRDQDSGATGWGSDTGEGLGNELFESIIDLMSNRRHGVGPGSPRPRSERSAPVSPDAAAESSRRLVRALSSVQAQTTTRDTSKNLVKAPGGVPSLEIDNDFLERIKVTLSEEREQALSQIERENLSPIDADLIDLIGMLFEYMLNDPVLPNLAKALLSHLHTPYLKVALIDRRLLVDIQHPARRLLDQLVESGSLWVDESNPQRGIFPAMQRIVDRVLQEFSDDVSLFETLLVDFEADMKEQQRRTETMEQRTQEAARGREKLQLAKRRATHQIQSLLHAHPLPQPVINFLGKTWLDHFVFILLRDKQGERGAAWKEAVETAENLAGLFAPGAAEQGGHPAGITEIKQTVSGAVQRMGSYSHSAVDALFELLDSPQTWASAASVSADSVASAAAGEGGRGSARGPAGESGSPQDISEQEQEVIARLRKMKFGTWFELASPSGGAPRRIKLSWLSPLTSTCMFVDRSGMQAEIKTLQELAQEILTGRAKVIPRPKHPFIERALVSIRKMLQGDEQTDSDNPETR